ncbi:phage portal protein [Streptomyces caniscabiei]|uniref:Phage portal protein n=1 Tax=Streptomyces caniscabiei TaxID=2746961 RepID=A0A927L165_9ACTN|nr:phage portal protein [Streptomyces caniscabiei]MBD9723454.1 phage portal protein [Streptomyces caniscabiei]MDX3516048.1 phage portal protein [Streptomyces caniscabiei]MDX3725146.1 phage portal protein [Streptomyces caniscabiei]WEO27024.1 phage portal protein [Streptomyces caniscabiei]
MGRRSIADALLNRTTTANPPIPFTGRSQSYGIFGSNRSAEGQMRAMSAVGTLFAIVDRTSNATALVDWKLWRKAGSGRDEDRVEVTSHAALDLWNRPNPFMPRQEFVESSTQHYDLTGETPWVIARHPGVDIPLELWPVRPDRITPVPDRDKFLKGYVYTSPDGEQIPLELNEVIFLRRPNPLDPYRGLSPVLSILPDLDTSRYAAEWSRAFFQNSAQPGGIIEVPVHLEDHEFDEMRERWAEQHKGVANAHKVAIVEYGAKWADRTISQRDMQFVELRGATADRVREAYGISKSAIGDFEDINRASALAAKAWFAEQQTIPRLERIKAALNFELLPMFGRAAEGLEFDYENPTPPDPETEAATLTARANAAKALAETGMWAPDGILSAVGLPEMEAAAAAGGDGTISPRELGDMIQSIYLGVDVCITWDEAREILNRAGAGLNLATPPPSKPAPPVIAPAPKVPASDGGSAEEEPEDSWQALVSGLTGDGGDGAEVENAMRWEAVAKIDDNTCGPCADNDGKTYRNRAQAYADYPGGSGYIHCTGAEFGNECRCKVVKRRKKEGDE